MSRKRETATEQWLCCKDNSLGSPGNHYIRLTNSLINCRAFRELSVNAQMLYIRMCMHARGKYTFTYPRKEHANDMSQATFQKCKEELIKNGFIKLAQSGRCTRTDNVYTFSYDWKNAARCEECGLCKTRLNQAQGDLF